MADKLLSRRAFIATAGSAGVVAIASQFPFARARTAPVRFTGYPFTLGVASGDPAPDSVVLWTRLAPSPLSANGGVPSLPVPVNWEVAADEHFRRVVARGSELATPEDAHTVHAEPRGLRPGSEYFYRFVANGEVSPVGRTKTAPAGRVSALAFAFLSCQRYEDGYYTALKHLSDEDVDLIIHTGDYIYEYDSPTPGTGNAVRANANDEIVNLDDYRVRHAQYKTDAALQAAHATAPWLVTFDDHEIDNNWASDTPEEGMPREIFLQRRAAAFKGYWEHMPLRKATRPAGSAIQIFRRAAYGDIATFHVMDTRQFRSDQACGDGTRAGCDDRNNPARTIVGAQQERWLYDGLQRSPSTWQILAQQVFMAQRDFTAGEGESYSMDGWDGYSVSRDKLLDFIETRRIANPIVITGDVHQHYAADLLSDFRDADSPILGSELVCTSITSGADGNGNANATLLAENPWIKYNMNRRGYVKVALDKQTMRADFKTVPYVKRPGAPLSIDRSFVVEAGVPGLKEA